MVVGGAGQLDRMLVDLEAGLVPRTLSSRSIQTKSDLPCPLQLLLSLIFCTSRLSSSLSSDIVSTFPGSPNLQERAGFLRNWLYFDQRLPAVVACGLSPHKLSSNFVSSMDQAEPAISHVLQSIIQFEFNPPTEVD